MFAVFDQQMFIEVPLSKWQAPRKAFPVPLVFQRLDKLEICESEVKAELKLRVNMNRELRGQHAAHQRQQQNWGIYFLLIGLRCEI